MGRYFILALTVILGAASRLIAEAPAPASQPASNVLGEYKIGRWAEPILMPVTWEGKEGYFLVDTGLVTNAVDSKAFSKLGLTPASLATAGGNHHQEMCEPPELRVGPFLLSHCGPVARIDLAFLSACFDRRVIGILGLAAFDDVVLQIDFDSHRLRFIEPDWNTHPEWGMPIPGFVDKNKVCILRTRMGGVEESMYLETSHIAFATLPTDELKSLANHENLAVRTWPRSTASGAARLDELTVPTLEIAGFKYRDQQIGETKSGVPSFGLEFLERHLTTIDFARHKLYLKEGKEFDRPRASFISGVNLWRQDNKALVYMIAPGSCAEQAGIGIGDVILEINGRLGADTDIYDLLDMLQSSQAGREVAVRLLHDGVEKTVTLKLLRDD